MLTRADFPAVLPQSALITAPPSLWAEIALAIAASVHPTDLWQLPEEAKRLSVAEVKALQQFALQTPRGASKLAILTDASAWSPQVANALLKLLEEPPAYLVVVVLSESDQLLPTVRSRLVQLSFPTRYAKLENKSDSRSDRQSWQQVLGRLNPRQPAARELATQALYLQSAMHSGHRTTVVLEALSESIDTL